MYKKLVIVTRNTRLRGLIERFNTRAQAKFYIEHAGGDFADYEREEEAYDLALEVLRRSLDFDVPQQPIDRSLVSTFQFLAGDVVITLGQDGLVANTAKYVRGQPIVAVTPSQTGSTVFSCRFFPIRRVLRWRRSSRRGLRSARLPWRR